MVKAAKASPAGKRKSSRGTKAPARFRPGSADMPVELLEMIRDVAAAAAKKSSVPFESGAVTALEEALEPMLEALCEAATKHATKAGRESISELDLQAVSKTFLKNKK